MFRVGTAEEFGEEVATLIAEDVNQADFGRVERSDRHALHLPVEGIGGMGGAESLSGRLAS
jgi:hypothetical protein